MSLFARPRREAPAVEERSGIPRIAVSGVGWAYVQGAPSSDAMRSVAHAAARRVLCTALASLPVQQITESGGFRRPVSASQVVRTPSLLVDQQAWIYQVVDSWLDCGNVYGDIVEFDSMGRPARVEIIDPSAVRWRQTNSGWHLYVAGEKRDPWPRGDVWHVAYLPQAGSPIGASPSDLAEMSVRTAISAERFGLDYFHSPHPTADVSVNADINAEQAQGIKDRLQAASRHREPFVHGKDITVTDKPVNPTDSQFLDLLRFECEQAARIYGVPPQMIYAATSGQSVTYANASQTDLSFLKWSLRWPMRRLQFAWSQFLPAPQVVRFNVDALLETTAMERAELHRARLDTKTRTVNEVRRLEDEPPFMGEQYDEPGIPGQVSPVAPADAIGGVNA